MKDDEILNETHKKGGKNDGIKPSDRGKGKGNKKNPPRFENLSGGKVE